MAPGPASRRKRRKEKKKKMHEKETREKEQRRWADSSVSQACARAGRTPTLPRHGTRGGEGTAATEVQPTETLRTPARPHPQ